MQFAPKLPPRTNWINFKFNHSGGFVLVWRVQLWFCNSHECLPPRTFSVLHGQYLGGRAQTPGIATSTTTFANMTDVFPPCSKRWNQFITKTWIEFEFSLVVVPFCPRFADPRMQFRVETRWESRVAFCMNLATPKLSVTTFLQNTWSWEKKRFFRNLTVNLNDGLWVLLRGCFLEVHYLRRVPDVSREQSWFPWKMLKRLRFSGWAGSVYFVRLGKFIAFTLFGKCFKLNLLCGWDMTK